MIAALIVIGFLALVILVLVVLFATQTIPTIPYPETAEVTYLLDSVSLQIGFSEPVATQGTRGQCNLYTTFTTDTTTVDSLIPYGNVDELPDEFLCNDGYSLALSKQITTCQTELCRGTDGLDYAYGESQIFYGICLENEPCENGRSAVILNAEYDSGKLTRSSQCIASNGTSFFSTPCPQTSTSQVNSFLNVDTQVLSYTPDYLVTRIRAPGTVNCLVSDGNAVGSIPCLSREDQGYSWILTTSNPSDTSYGELYYPSRLIVSPTEIPTDIDQLNNILRQSNQLEGNISGQLLLNKYTQCTTGQTCYPAASEIVSGFVYQNLV
jgi:hypothetical protein